MRPILAIIILVTIVIVIIILIEQHREKRGRNGSRQEESLSSEVRSAVGWERSRRREHHRRQSSRNESSCCQQSCCKKSESKKPKEPIVGTHNLNLTIFTNIPALETNVYVVFECHDDNTFIFHGSEFLTQSVGGNQGVLDTVLLGYWKKTGFRKYHLRGTFVQLFRDPVNPALPAIPMYRWLVDGDFDLSNGIDGVFSGSATAHPVDDLTLSLPATGPMAGITLEAEGVTKKLSP